MICALVKAFTEGHVRKQVATETAATLDGQTKQMETVLDSLDEIHFSLKKANQVIRDITRRIATDKCVLTRLTSVRSDMGHSHVHTPRSGGLRGQRCGRPEFRCCPTHQAFACCPVFKTCCSAHAGASWS